jgi:hypothetical protein
MKNSWLDFVPRNTQKVGKEGFLKKLQAWQSFKRQERIGLSRLFIT